MGGGKNYNNSNSNNNDVTLMFESVVVRDTSSRTNKKFSDVCVEVVGKEVYIGSSYKIKWKNVTSLQCRNDMDDNYDEEDDTDARYYREEDYARAGFELTCTKGNSNNNNDRRVVTVRFPVPPEGHRYDSWKGFARILTNAYQKECRKRQRKIEREEALRRNAEEDRREQLRQSRAAPTRTTYSKRPYDFMRKNAANIAQNAEIWSDDDEYEDAAASPPVDHNDTVQDEPIVEEDNNDDDDDVPRNKDNGDDDDDDEEQEFRDDGSNHSHSKELAGDEDSGAVDPEHNHDDDDDDDDIPLAKPVSTRKKRLVRRAPILDDSDDEDDTIFGNSSSNNKDDEPKPQTRGTTSPKTSFQRVVTPAVASIEQKPRRSLEDDDDDDDDDEEGSPQQTKKPINSFFQPRFKAAAIGKKSTTTTESEVQETSNNGDNDATIEIQPTRSKSKPQALFFAPRSTKPTTAAHRSGASKTPVRTPTRTKTKPSKSVLKTLLDDDSDETSTVVPESTGMVDVDEDDDEDALVRSKTPLSPTFKAYSPKQSKMHTDLVRRSGGKVHVGSRSEPTSIEEEDPIDSSQSQSSPANAKQKRSRLFSSSRLSSSIKRRRLRLGQESASGALQALEFADARSLQDRSPVPAKTSVREGNTSGADRSPLQPLRLGPQVEKAATDRELQIAKWKGLRNDGNSCYLNSSLQQLFSIPHFLEALSKREETGHHELAHKLVDLYETLSSRKSNKNNETLVAASAKGVKTVMDRLTDRFRGCQQRDAHEFLGELIDQLHEELSGNNIHEEKENDNPSSSSEKKEGTATEPTDEFFRWNVQVCLECKSCGYSRSKEEMHRYLSIDIGSETALGPRDPGFVKPAVDSCLAKFFSPEDREINCEKCKVGKIATQTMKVLSLPKVILLHLKRFIAVEKPVPGSETKETELVFQKNKVPVELTPTLTVENILAKTSDNNQSSGNKYRLKSVVHHIGSTANSGHYTTDALRADPENGEKEQWVSYDDGVTAEKTLERVIRPVRNQSTAYMLLYSV